MSWSQFVSRTLVAATLKRHWSGRATSVSLVPRGCFTDLPSRVVALYQTSLPQTFSVVALYQTSLPQTFSKEVRLQGTCVFRFP